MTTAVVAPNCVPLVLPPVLMENLAVLAAQYGVTITGVGVKPDGGAVFDLFGADISRAGQFGEAASLLLRGPQH